MKKEYTRIETENGYFLFKLQAILNDKGISKNKIMRDTDTRFDVLQHYIYGTLKRIDIDIVDRLCTYLDCEFTDIIEYVRNK